MRRGNLIKFAKRALAVILSASMVLSSAPQYTVTAADDTPYVISAGRMAYSSSDNGGSTADNAVDGNATTRWESSWNSEPQWFYVDLGKKADITSVYIKWEGAYAKEYKIQFSDDEEYWWDVYTNSSCNGGDETLNISGSARYVRIYMTKKALEAYGYSFFEFQVYGLNGVTQRPDAYGDNLALGKSTATSGLRDVWWMYNNGVLDQSTVLDKNAVDGDENTSWTSAEDDNQWIYVDLGQSYEIGRVIIKWTEDAGKIYDIQTSNDAQNWNTVYRCFDGSPEWEDNVAVYASSARYIRIYGYTKVSNGSGFGIKELEVYKYISGEEKKTYTIEDLPEMSIINKTAGSYVSTAMYLETAKLPKYIDEENIEMPIDSNDWYQSAMIKKFGNPMSTLPFKAGYSKRGLSILTTTEGWLPTPGATDVNLSVLTETTPDLYILPENVDTTSAYDRVHDYSDYTASLQLCDDNGVAMTSTHVKGSPYIFCEFGDRESVFVSVPNLTAYFDNGGNQILAASSSSMTTDHIGIHVTDDDNKDKTKTSNSYYCLTLPQGTKVKNVGGKLKITFPSTDRYMSVATMGSRTDLNTYYQHGYAFVTDSSVGYVYSEGMSNIESRYELTTELKRSGFSNVTMQCMLPHQWKKSTDDNSKAATYKSIRGDMYAIWSNSFKTNETFDGLLPTFAMPSSADFDQQKVLEYLYTLDSATANLNPAADAYWEGKNLHPLGMGVLMADQLGETELRDTFLARLKKILINWFTYDGSDDVSYLIYDEHWGTIYYSQSEFGANWGICDHHFTYGYFIFGATVLATYDKEFYAQYKDMIEILIRDYANPSDNDSEYCRFRAYDLYEGHSWAGGYADNDSGNNQESASESLFSWVGLYLWGVLTEDDTYRDAGIFGFTNEMEAVKQYWFDYDKDNWIDEWPYEVVAQVYGGINFYGTFFGGQPLYCYGIQWLPVSEYLTYYGMNQTRAAEIYQGLLDDTTDAMNKAVIAANNEGKSQEEIDKLINEYPQADTGWQHITWPFLAQTNPTLALSKFNENVDKVQRTDHANTYWFIHSVKELGVKTEDIIATGDPSASVYYNKDTGKYTANVWNPCDSSKTVTFKDANGNTLGTAKVGAKSLVSFEVSKAGNFAYSQVETPTFKTTGLSDGKVNDNISGTYSYDDTQIVEISCANSGATIYYTTDGSIPTANSNVYTGKFLVSSTTTVKAIAVRDGYIDSTYASLALDINGDSVEGTDNLARGKSVYVSSLQGADGGYAATNCTDGSYDTRWSSASGNDDDWCYVDLGREYQINTVKLFWEAACGKEYQIQVSTNGTNWTTVATVNNGSQGQRDISFDAVKARYVKMQGVKRATDYGYSLYEFEVYGALQAAAPSISVASGTYDTSQTVTLSTSVKGAEIKYTLDGTMPTEDSPSYTEPITIDKSAIVNAVTYRKGMTLSNVTTSNITIKGTVALSSSNMVVAVGNSKKLTAITDGTVTWSSSNTSVATVDGSGNVTGVAIGTATITARVGSNTATCQVTVKEAVKLQSISLSATTLTMTVKTTDMLTVTFNPADTTDDTAVIWGSSNSSVVSVNNGVITAKQEGTATISARCGNCTATCIVTVNPKYTIEEKLVNSEYNVMLNNAKLYQSGCFEGELSNLVDKTGFGTSSGDNWASQTVNASAGSTFLIIDLDKEYTIAQIQAMYIQWKNNTQTLPTDGFKIMVANDANFNIATGVGQKQSQGNPNITIVTADYSNWTTVFDSASNDATNAENGYDWAVNDVGCLSILPFKNDNYTGTFDHIKIQFNYSGSEKTWGIQAYEIALLINDLEVEEETTEAPTTAAPTTVAPTTQAPTTTQAPEVEQPQVPFGVVVSNIAEGQFTIEMGNPGNGQTYNLYIDGQFKQNITLGAHVITGVSSGTHTVALTGVLNGMESEKTEIQVTIPEKETTEAPTTEAPTTEAPTTAAPEPEAIVEINGYQISTVEEGFRTVYSVYDPENEIVSAGMLYGIGNVTEADMTIETKGSSVYNFVASDSGKMEVSFSQYESAQSYSMTMKFAKTAAFYNTKMTVRAYAQLEDGTYIYSNTKSYTVYKLADYLYQNLLMNSLDSHNYLYENILSVVDSSYKVKDFAWNNSIVKPSDIKDKMQ